ncbi:hypothetical protein HZA38_04525 [Candidatus Peregrinibacteria bacterium]|nr:hypothetical protein [Candidatus Peregrinibacteria bacterium]
METTPTLHRLFTPNTGNPDTRYVFDRGAGLYLRPQYTFQTNLEFCDGIHPFIQGIYDGKTGLAPSRFPASAPRDIVDPEISDIFEKIRAIPDDVLLRRMIDVRIEMGTYGFFPEKARLSEQQMAKTYRGVAEDACVENTFHALYWQNVQMLRRQRRESILEEKPKVVTAGKISTAHEMVWSSWKFLEISRKQRIFNAPEEYLGYVVIHNSENGAILCKPYLSHLVGALIDLIRGRFLQRSTQLGVFLHDDIEDLIARLILLLRTKNYRDIMIRILTSLPLYREKIEQLGEVERIRKDLETALSNAYAVTKEEGKTSEETNAKNLKKLLIAMLKDPNACRIKLRDRRNNSATFPELRPSTRTKKIKETRQVHSRLARLQGDLRLEEDLNRFSFAAGKNSALLTAFDEEMAKGKTKFLGKNNEKINLVYEGFASDPSISRRISAVNVEERRFSSFLNNRSGKAAAKEDEELTIADFDLDRYQRNFKIAIIVKNPEDTDAIIEHIRKNFTTNGRFHSDKTRFGTRVVVSNPKFGGRLEFRINDEVSEERIPLGNKDLEKEMKEKIEYILSEESKGRNIFEAAEEVFDANMTVYTPQHEAKVLSRDARVLDFTVQVHGDIALRATGARLAKTTRSESFGRPCSLFEKLSPGQVVFIEEGEDANSLEFLRSARYLATPFTQGIIRSRHLQPKRRIDVAKKQETERLRANLSKEEEEQVGERMKAEIQEEGRIHLEKIASVFGDISPDEVKKHIQSGNSIRGYDLKNDQEFYAAIGAGEINVLNAITDLFLLRLGERKIDTIVKRIPENVLLSEEEKRKIILRIESDPKLQGTEKKEDRKREQHQKIKDRKNEKLLSLLRKRNPQYYPQRYSSAGLKTLIGKGKVDLCQIFQEEVQSRITLTLPEDQCWEIDLLPPDKENVNEYISSVISMRNDANLIGIHTSDSTQGTGEVRRKITYRIRRSETLPLSRLFKRFLRLDLEGFQVRARKVDENPHRITPEIHDEIFEELGMLI